VYGQRYLRKLLNSLLMSLSMGIKLLFDAASRLVELDPKTNKPYPPSYDIVFNSKLLSGGLPASEFSIFSAEFVKLYEGIVSQWLTGTGGVEGPKRAEGHQQGEKRGRDTNPPCRQRQADRGRHPRLARGVDTFMEIL
jgi:hypothetical protein